MGEIGAKLPDQDDRSGSDEVVAVIAGSRGHPYIGAGVLWLSPIKALGTKMSVALYTLMAMDAVPMNASGRGVTYTVTLAVVSQKTALLVQGGQNL